MPCDNFEINESGKITMNNVNDLGNLTLSNENLSISELLGEKYILNKESIISLENYTEQNLEKNPIYFLVGENKKAKYGLASRITDLDKLNEIVREFKNNP
ncbi:hypothetical protein KAI04_00705 [Candidatus Pacearchaeota archaeon]|nr:hypothetical protein [Candidatus Pacearchaeota archaeon]